MRKLFALAVLCAGIASAQYDVYKFSRSGTLSTGTTAFTIALPPTGDNDVRLLDFTLQCSADCTPQTERDGTAPTAPPATLGSWRPEDKDSAPKLTGVPIQPAVRIYYDSNSTGGTLADEPFVFPAGALVPWSTGAVALTGSGLTTNYTIRITAAIGTTYRFQLRARIRR